MTPFIKVSLSPTGDGLAAEMPSGHSVNFPATEKGARFLLMLLTEQESAKTRQMGVGSKASPTQSMVDKWLLSNTLKSYDSKGQLKGEYLSLEDLGLI